MLMFIGSPFVMNAGRDSSTVGKLAALRIFEEMNALGYDLVFCFLFLHYFDKMKENVGSSRSRPPTSPEPTIRGRGSFGKSKKFLHA